MWIVYLWEPLPHVAPLDRITYPVADGLALIVMGLLLGWLFGQTRLPVKSAVGSCPPFPDLSQPFGASRAASVLRYRYLFVLPRKNRRDLLWCLLAGFVIACAMAWLNRYVDGNSRIKKIVDPGRPAVWGWICFCSISLCRWFCRRHPPISSFER